MTEKAPQGGCALKQIHYELGTDGSVKVLKLDTIAYCTTLIEANDIESRMKSEALGEAAVRPPVRETAPLAQYQSPSYQVAPSQPPFEQMPKVVGDMANPPPREPDPGLVDRIRKAGGNLRTGTNGWVWFAVLTLGYMAQRMA